MPFGPQERRRIRREAGYRCMICNEWHPPDRRGRVSLDAHSLDRTHKDEGMAVCPSTEPSGCHGKLHQLTDDPQELRKISEEAARLAGAAMLTKLEEAGMPEKRVRRILSRRPY